MISFLRPAINFWRTIQGKRAWWTIVLAVVLLVGMNFWLYPAIKNLREDAIFFQKSSVMLAREKTESLAATHIFSPLQNAMLSLAVSPGDKDAIFRGILSTQSQIKEIKMFDKDGKLSDYYQIKDKKIEKLEILAEPSFSGPELMDAVLQGGTYRTPIFFENSDPFLEIARGIRSGGIFTGALLFKIDLGFISQSAIETSKIKKDERIFIADINGNLLGHSDYPENLPSLSEKQKEAVAKFIGEGKDEAAFSYINEKGENAHATFAPFKFFLWAVVVEEPLTKMFSASNNMLLLAFFVALAELVLLTLFIRNNFSLVKTARVLRESQSALEEAKTVLEIKVQARTRELRELAHSLEAMVAERTKDLQERIQELERFGRLTVGREIKMIELKKELAELRGGKNKGPVGKKTKEN